MLGRYREYADEMLSRRPADHQRYRAMLADAVEPGWVVLHLGCGWDRTGVLPALPENTRAIGVDLDPSAAERYPGEVWLADAARLPFSDRCFDAIFSEYVLEHLQDADTAVREWARVLRPGGVVVALTPSLYSYKSLIAAATPLRFHQWSARVLRGRAAEDVYPTAYQLNSHRRVVSLATTYGFEVETFIYTNNGPTWFRRIPGLFELGLAYHRLLDMADLLGPLRCGIVFVLRKRDPSDGIDHEQVRRQPLLVRCLTCGTEPMEGSHEAGFSCDSCGARYTHVGKALVAG